MKEECFQGIFEHHFKTFLGYCDLKDIETIQYEITI